MGHVLVNSKLVPSYSDASILSKVASACSKNPYTILLLNSRSSSSSSISRICSKVSWSIESPQSGKLREAVSDFKQRVSMRI